MRSTGSTCENPYKPFFQGERREAGEVLWNVACATGGEYVVQIKANGTTIAARCADVKALTGIPCFQTLK